MNNDGLALKDAQWNRIRQVVHDEALRARVAASFLPLYGPLEGSVETVPANRLRYGQETAPPPLARMEVDDYQTLRLITVATNVYLKNHMVADPELAAATIMFRRAADIVARVEDALIFNGKDDTRGDPVLGVAGVESVYTVGGASRYAGLMDFGGSPLTIDKPRGKTAAEEGPAIFETVVRAVIELESRGHHRPFACVLGNDLFVRINRPLPNSMVLPRDSIPPLIDGPLLRCSNMPSNSGLLISLQGDPVEIVVPSDIAVRYLQTTLDAKHVFRVSQRFVLRVKETTAIATFGDPEYVAEAEERRAAMRDLLDPGYG